MNTRTQSSRDRLLANLLQACTADRRVVGLIDYGSGGHERADEWSDVDAALLLRDEDYEGFITGWQSWSSGLGDQLFAYVGRFGHWAMYEGEALPLRVDLDFLLESEMELVTTWPMTPVRVESMVLYDGTSGKLTSVIRGLIGRRDRPEDALLTLERLIGDFWYFSLFCASKIGRGEAWVARLVFHSQVLDNLALLLRLEAGAVDRWEGAHAAAELEQTVSGPRLAQLEACIPAPGKQGLLIALETSCRLGDAVGRALAVKHGIAFPARLAAQTSAAISRLRSE